jgi:hypothetical protein
LSAHLGGNLAQLAAWHRWKDVEPIFHWELAAILE